MEMGEAGRFTATGLQQPRALGFRNLEGHRFMSADDGYLYLRAIRKGERSSARIFHFTSNGSRFALSPLRRPRAFAICPLEAISLGNFYNYSAEEDERTFAEAARKLRVRETITKYKRRNFNLRNYSRRNMLAEIKHRSQVKYCLREVNIHAFTCLSGERSTEGLIRARATTERERRRGREGCK